MYERYNKEEYIYPDWILVNDFDNPPAGAVNFGPERFNEMEEGNKNTRDSLHVARYLLPKDTFLETDPIDEYPVSFESVMEVSDWNGTTGIVKTIQGETTVRKQYYITDTDDYRRISNTNSRPVWQANTDYVEGDQVEPTLRDGRYYEVSVAGTSGNTEPIWSPTVDVEDDSITWIYGGNYWGEWERAQYM